MIIGVYGFQDAGKTTLVEDLVRALVRKGHTVASVKHTTHAKSVDSEGKDTWRHWKAGSDPVVFMSSIETSIIKHSRTTEEKVVEMVLREFGPEVLVIEGNKEGDYPKVRIGAVPKRPGTVLSNPSMKTLLAYIERGVALEKALRSLPGLDCGKCGLDCRGLADAVVAGRRRISDCKELSEIGAEVFVGGRRLPMGRFATQVVDGTVRGVLSGMKGYEPGGEVEIRLLNKRTKAKRRKRKR